MLGVSGDSVRITWAICGQRTTHDSTDPESYNVMDNTTPQIHRVTIWRTTLHHRSIELQWEGQHYITDPENTTSQIQRVTMWRTTLHHRSELNNARILPQLYCHNLSGSSHSRNISFFLSFFYFFGRQKSLLLLQVVATNLITVASWHQMWNCCVLPNTSMSLNNL